MNVRAPLLLVAMTPLTAHAQVVFQDNFDAENAGVSALNYAGFANWAVTDGTVDIIGNGSFDYYPGNGLYVDLDGSSFDPGVLTSTGISLTQVRTAPAFFWREWL